MKDNMVSVKTSCAFVLSILLVASFTSAITGSIGNARMILRVNDGDVIERSILIKNTNDVAVDIEISPSGGFEATTEMIESEFRLEPGSEKKAFFKMRVTSPGTTETLFNIKFSPVEGGNGVGLSSKVIVIANESESSGLFDVFSRKDNDEVNNNNNNETYKSNENRGNKINILPVLIILFLFVIVLLIVLLRMVSKKKTKKVVEVDIKEAKTKPKKSDRRK